VKRFRTCHSKPSALDRVPAFASTARIRVSGAGVHSRALQPQARPERDVTDMAKHGEEMNEETSSARSKADFIRLAGIGSDLAEFVNEFIEKPENFISMTFEQRRDIEIQMDAILSSFGR
jgi:hypothetical protein